MWWRRASSGNEVSEATVRSRHLLALRADFPAEELAPFLAFLALGAFLGILGRSAARERQGGPFLAPRRGIWSPHAPNIRMVSCFGEIAAHTSRKAAPELWPRRLIRIATVCATL
jgi:hypothetical protein